MARLLLVDSGRVPPLVINGRETFRLTPDTEQSSFFEFAVPTGSALFVPGFNRIAFERRSGTAPMALYRFAVE